ncbi:MAG: efflux RND transporter permease subunit [Planctomycetes bacterium]|nr:efflux RND transporter permease subunit [Planctomycetota bacterium]
MTDAAPQEQPQGEQNRLVRLFVDRPVTTLVATIAILVVGALALARMPLQLAPDGLTAGSINLWIPIRRDMPPREVEERVVRPLEEQLRTVPGIKRIACEAGRNRVFCRVELDNGIDTVLAAAEVRDRAQRARLEWPAEVDQYFSWREDMSGAPLAFVRLRTPDRGPEWDFKMDQVVRPRLEAVDGVGRCELWGLVDETLRILFDRDKLVEHQVDYGEVLRRLAADNFTKPVGEIDDGNARYLVRVDTKFTSRDEIERWPIRPGLVIGDVARVIDVPSVRDNVSKFEGDYTYTAVLRLAAGTNPVEASHNVRAATKEIERSPELAGLGFTFLFDQGEMIEESLVNLLSSSLQGGALAVLVLFLFLRNFRLTLVVALSMPLALTIAIGWMFFAGDSFNILSMTGLTLAVGMVVDNSVVVLENILRRRSTSSDLRGACIRGASEIVMPVTMSTLTTVVVIAPLVFMSSERGVRTMFAALGMPLCIALVGSLAIALGFLPSAVRHLGVGRAALLAESGFGRFSPMRALLLFNRLLLRPVLAGFWWRCAAAVAALALIFTTGIAWNGLSASGGGGGGPMRRGDVTINLEIPRGMTLGDVAAEVEQYEAHLDARRKELRIESVASRFSRTSIRFDVGVARDVPRTEYRAISNRLRDEWPKRPGVKLTLRDSGASMGGGSSADDKTNTRFVLRIWGRDSEFLANKALEVRDRLARREEVATVEVDSAQGNEELVVTVDRDRLSDLRVRPESLERTMSAGLRGSEIARFQERDREVRLIVQFDGEEKPSVWDLKETKVFAGASGFQRVDDLVDVRFERSLAEIDRIDGKTQVTVVGDRRDTVSAQQMSVVLRDVMGATFLPRGYEWSEASPNREAQEDFKELADAGFLAIVLILLLMGVLFESLVLPAAIIVTVPFAIFGAFWSLRILAGSIDPMAFIGVVLLAGVVVNNGIILLDCIERLRRDGVDRNTAILDATRIRLRPIAMTAATTIAGLLPMAIFGDPGDDGISYVGMSIAVAGGLAVSTVLTAFAVPLAYLFFDDLSNWGRGILARLVFAGDATDAQPVSSAKPQSL